MKIPNKWLLPCIGLGFILLLGAGCGSGAAVRKAGQLAVPPSGEKCETDEDCGFSVCAAKNIRRPECVDRSCRVAETDCGQGKHCVQDSRGIKCADVVGAAPPDKPQMSCRLNSNQIKMTGVNAFKKSWFTCGSDCPKDFVCDLKTCLCKEAVKEDKEKRCEDEPVFAYATDKVGVQGLKDSYKTFTTKELDGLSDEEVNGYIARAKKVVVPAYNRGQNYFPFPQEQFSVKPPSPNHVPCANEYYAGIVGVDIHRAVWLDPGDCGFGPTGVMDGYLLICPEELFNWYDSVTAFDALLMPSL